MSINIMEPSKGYDPLTSRWQREILPLNYEGIDLHNVVRFAMLCYYLYVGDIDYIKQAVERLAGLEPACVH